MAFGAVAPAEVILDNVSAYLFQRVPQTSGATGSTTIGDYTVVGGQSAFKGHITVGSRVRIAGNTMVWGDIPDGASVSGQPARDHREELKQQVRLRNLDKLYERVSALEQK